MRTAILLSSLFALSSAAFAQNRPVVQVAAGQSIEVASNAICFGPQETVFDPIKRDGRWYCEVPPR